MLMRAPEAPWERRIRPLVVVTPNETMPPFSDPREAESVDRTASLCQRDVAVDARDKPSANLLLGFAPTLLKLVATDSGRYRQGQREPLAQGRML